jgi:hypothetical protein
MLAAVNLLSDAFDAVLGSEAALANTAAVAGLASALTSLVKRTVQFTAAARQLQDQPSQAANKLAAAYFPAAVTRIIYRLQRSFTAGLHSAAVRGNSGSSEIACGTPASSSQAAASIALLAVVLARSLVQLADAMEAAGRQLLFDSLMAKPRYKVFMKAGERYLFIRQQLSPYGTAEHHTTAMQWHSWQLQMFNTALAMFRALDKLGIAAATAAGPPPPAAAAAVPADLCTHTCSSVATTSGITAGGGGSSEAPSQGSSSSTSTAGQLQPSSTNQQVKWGYLLRLQQRSPHWAAAVAAFDAKWPGWRSDMEGLFTRGGGSKALLQIEQQYTDALQLCRALAAAAPLPIYPVQQPRL